MNLREGYITGAGAFLPGEPVANDRMEDHLGRIEGRDSVLGKKALRWNGVEARHYAMTPDGTVVHTNADMCARAVRQALERAGLGVGDLGMLAAATTQGDYLVPGHATAVHAELGAGPIEIASFQSVCGSSLMAAKAAWLAVRAGEHDVASACAGEFASRWFRPSFYEGTALVDAKGRLRAEADFLRFTLSDGAGAVVIEPTPRPGALRIRFIDIVSLADRFDPCMWAGGGDRHSLRPQHGVAARRARPGRTRRARSPSCRISSSSSGSSAPGSASTSGRWTRAGSCRPSSTGRWCTTPRSPCTRSSSRCSRTPPA